MEELKRLNSGSKSGVSRREFLGKTAAAAAGFSIVPRHVLGGAGFVPPSDKVNIAGAATINGGAVQVIAASGNYATSTTYTILTASGGRNGTYSSVSTNFAFLTQSCVETEDTIKWTDGKEYPLYKLEISSASHPFFTGKMKFVDTTGRVEKFQKKYQKSGYGAKKAGAEGEKK